MPEPFLPEPFLPEPFLPRIITCRLTIPDATWFVSLNSLTVPTKDSAISLCLLILRKVVSTAALPATNSPALSMSPGGSPCLGLRLCGVRTSAPGQTSLIASKSWSMFTTMRSAWGVFGSSSIFVKAPMSGTRARSEATLVARLGRASLKNITRPSMRVMASMLWVTARAAPAGSGPPGSTIFTAL